MEMKGDYNALHYQFRKGGTGKKPRKHKRKREGNKNTK